MTFKIERRANKDLSQPRITGTRCRDIGGTKSIRAGTDSWHHRHEDGNRASRPNWEQHGDSRSEPSDGSVGVDRTASGPNGNTVRGSRSTSVAN